VIGGVAHTAEEAFEAVSAGLGVAIVAEGNAQLYHRDGIVTRPIRELSPAHLALAWRHGDHREILRAAIDAVRATGEAVSR
jgi:DNA-binding transcriptional LysR family regulator